MQDYPNGTDEIVNTTYATAQEIKALNNKFFSTFSGKRTETNKIAVSSMLDTTLWNVYMDKSDKTGKAKYAIGGPTIEMLINSYNEKYNLFNNQGKGKYQIEVQSENNSGYGYRISSDYGTEWSVHIPDSTNYLDKTDPLYINQDTNSNAYGYWLSSPHTGQENQVSIVKYDGNVQGAGYQAKMFGFRPMVCLQSGVKLEKVEEGKFKIID